MTNEEFLLIDRTSRQFFEKGWNQLSHTEINDLISLQDLEISLLRAYNDHLRAGGPTWTS